MYRARRLILIAGAASALFASSLALAEPAAPSSLGRTIDAFDLRDVWGKSTSLDEVAGDSKFTVVAFLGTECPLVKLYVSRLDELAQRFADQGVAFVGIDSNVQDTLTEAAAFARREAMTFPLLVDPDGAIADRFGATRNPEIFVLDATRTVRYHGRIDNQYEPGIQRPAATRDDLVLALNDLLADRPVEIATTTVEGCLIGRAKEVTVDEPTLTYAEDVATILHTRCVECHRPGEIAPFPLLSYDDAYPWGEMIAEVVREQRMPPWFANPEYGEFSNACQLPASERETILAWVDQGCPPGDLAAAPAPPEFVEGWGIGEPEMILPMSRRPFKVPATGTLPYEHYVVDPKFTEDVWISASEARPGNRAVVHHILVFAVPPGSSAPIEFLNGRLIAAYAPGVPAQSMSPGRAVFLPKGTKFILQMHYTPNGTPHEDLSQLGLCFTTADKVRQPVQSGMAINFLLMIPPGASNAQFRASHRFDEDRELLAMTPHMHLRGKAFRYEAQYPDGSSEILLDVPEYDFNWQITYELSEPKLLPRGTRLNCTATYDNSADNPNNPDPTRLVTFGEQTWDEMMIGWFVTGAVTDTSVAEAKP